MGMSWSSTFSKVICNVIGNVYPAYASYLAVQAADPNEHKQWLMYWIVNTVFIILELLADQVVSWVPLYWEAKIAFVLWLTLPRFRGATYIYENIVAPYLEEYEPHIDEHLDSLAATASAGVEQLRTVGAHHMRERSTELLTLMANMVSPKASTTPALPPVMEAAPKVAAAPTALHAVPPPQPEPVEEGKDEVLHAGEDGFDVDGPASELRQRRK